MAKIQKRTWLGRGPTGHKVRKVAWGYTLQVGRKQERKFSVAPAPHPHPSARLYFSGSKCDCSGIGVSSSSRWRRGYRDRSGQARRSPLLDCAPPGEHGPYWVSCY
jgi:hypothetical protein